MREALIGRALHESLADHVVARHGTAAVRIEFAKLVAQIILVQEEVEARHGQKVVVVARQHDEAMQLLGKVKELAITLVVKVASDHLAENAMHGRYLIGDIGAVLFVEEVWYVGKWRRRSMNPDI